MSTSNDCDVMIVVEYVWQIYIVEFGHVYTSFIVYENYSQG
mgnify:FL=1